jgi:hypothetical protein
METLVQFPISRKAPVAVSPTHTRPRPFQEKLLIAAMA